MSDESEAEPTRVQLRRTKGWRKPEGAVVVARPSRWGNPWTIAEWVAMGWREDDARNMAVACFKDLIADRVHAEATGEPHHHIEGVYPELDEVRSTLAGRDLACWCPLDQPCHADVLLELANATAEVDG